MRPYAGNGRVFAVRAVSTRRRSAAHDDDSPDDDPPDDEGFVSPGLHESLEIRPTPHGVHRLIDLHQATMSDSCSQNNTKPSRSVRTARHTRVPARPAVVAQDPDGFGQLAAMAQSPAVQSRL